MQPAWKCPRSGRVARTAEEARGRGRLHPCAIASTSRVSRRTWTGSPSDGEPAFPRGAAYIRGPSGHKIESSRSVEKRDWQIGGTRSRPFGVPHENFSGRPEK